MTQQKEFGFWRSLFWPVRKEECAKVVSMLSLLFLLCISYSILRNLKDTLLLNAKGSGAEAIPFIKVWGMLPAAFFATFVYTRLSRIFSRKNIFYIIIGGFLSFYLLFAFLLFPNLESLYLSSLVDFSLKALPSGFKGFIALVANWPITLFYVFAELWATMMLSVLFWGFANDTTDVSEAKRTYGILNVGSNIAPILGGSIALLATKYLKLPLGFLHTSDLGETLARLMVVVAILGLASMGLYRLIVSKIVSYDDKVGSETSSEKPKERLSVRESIKFLSKSKYLLCVALIVLGFNIAINFTDILWKEQLKKFFSNPKDMLNHMNTITVWTGVFATVLGTLFSLMISRLGWTFVALLTPAMMVTMAVGFFSCLFIGKSDIAQGLIIMGLGPQALTVYFGSAQNALSKAGKYSVFDATKEMAFLPLDQEAKRKGKAAIDGLGSGVGKSGASLLYQAFIIVLGSVSVSTPYIALLLVAVFAAWIYSVFNVGKAFKAISQNTQELATE
jgi:ATP:ADP antiporter, AAA family